MTILVESPVDRRMHSETANLLMAYEGVFAEQVGFIELPDDSWAWARLQMAGGEFCGNATMSLAAWLVSKRGAEEGETAVPLEVSGADGVIECAIKNRGDYYSGTLLMPLPERIGSIVLPVNGKRREFTAVWLPGIIHVMVPAGMFGEDMRGTSERAAKEWSGYMDAEAFGIINIDEKLCRIDPLICVKSSGTLVWERGCGSGSAAVGAYMARKSSRSARSMVTQPGGVITVSAEYSGGTITSLSIMGNVKIVARGTAYI